MQRASLFNSTKSGAFSHFDTQLAALALDQEASQYGAGYNKLADQFDNAVLRGSDGKQYVTIDVIAKDGDGAHLLSQLNAAGLQHGTSFGSIASGVIAVDRLTAVAKLGDLGSAREAAYIAHTGSVESQTDHALHADSARTNHGVDGSGQTIGIISDSFNVSGNGSMAGDIASGDLPAGTNIVFDASSGTDEGRAIAQLVHDIAPGAAIDFATGVYGQAGMANAILEMANSTSIMVDDLGFLDELAYQNGPIAQAIELAQQYEGVTYFSAAGNNGHQGLEEAWHTGGTFNVTFAGSTETLMQFSPGKDYLPVVLGSDEYFVLQWDQKGASAGHASTGAQSDLDLFLTDKSGSVIYSYATTNNIGGDPVEVMHVTGGAGKTYYLRVGLYSGAPPTEIKLMALANGGSVQLGTTPGNFNNGTTFGHATAYQLGGDGQVVGDAAIAVGAAYYANTPAYGTDPAVLQPFSSTGSARMWFDDYGNRLAQPVDHHGPVFVAPDGGNTTFFGLDTDGDGLPNFPGTSASAPDAAAAALLIASANPNFTPQDIENLMIDSISDMGAPGYDDANGFGLIDADEAVGFAQTLDISNPNATDLYGTHFDDTIRLNASTPVIGKGFDGEDTIIGWLTYDPATMGTRFETLDGGNGSDVLEGNAGNDLFDGGDGEDLVTYVDASTGVKVVLSNPLAQNTGEGKDTFVGIEDLVGSGFADKLTGSDGDNVINGGAGGDKIWGDAGNDLLNGGADDDKIDGGAGSDRIIGGAGNDSLMGGDGSDTFVFTNASDTAGKGDMIRDLANDDWIDLSAIDADGDPSNGDQAFTFIAGNHFTHSAGQLLVALHGTKTYIEGDINGDGIADFRITAVGDHHDFSNFIL